MDAISVYNLMKNETDDKLWPMYVEKKAMECIVNETEKTASTF